ncbi:rhophilin-1 isoform X6 [Trachypithecus francoisi]|uniref:rhophilin-1 isoform X6 n=1 Tax=Trachypithecus francoisi TaxID=54180 RepID=UPI00141B7124|nr:rhophilin-1 isoform X6 [Trachypithecus francoisi]
MILEERPDGAGAGKEGPRLQGCDSPMQMRCSQLQSRRARIHQQIDKELQMRTGAENLYRATRNNQVRETVALELSYVNSNLQLLKEELEELSSAMDPGRHGSEAVTVPMIPLGLKETKELDWSTPLKELISVHFGEDGASYEAEIRELEALRQIGARQNRSCTEGAHRAVEAFQRAAGTFSLLRENFSHAPSPDMSPASLCALEQLMMAQAQECVFEGLSPPASTAPQDCLAQLRLAQEAAQVAAEYRLVHQTMAQPPVHDYMPVSWTALVHVKAEYFRSLAHYYVAMALCDGSPATEGELPTHEQVFLQPPTSCKPQGPVLPQELEERRQLGKAHLKRAILGQEEALRLHALCRVLREVDLLRAVVAQTLQRSLAKYAELDREDDFCETAEAPDIQPKTHQKPEARTPRLSQGKGPDIFHRLGPLSVFSAKNRWRLVGPIHLTRGEGGFGLTLRGDSPVLIAAVIPGSQAAAAGLKEGDYIVSVNGQPCRWWRHAEVVAELKAAGEAGASLQVVSVLPSSRLPSLGDRRPALLGPMGLLSSQREHSCTTPASTWASPRPLLSWSRKGQQGKPGGCPQPRAPVKPALPSSSKRPGWL